jgi:CTP:molybdopterin cytidylyltransferase MocA
VHAHAAALVNVPVSDDGAFLDLDTPADYERALALAARAGALSACRDC